MKNNSSNHQAFITSVAKTLITQAMRISGLIALFICLMNINYVKAGSWNAVAHTSVNRPDTTGPGNCQANFSYVDSGTYTVEFTSTSYSTDSIIRYHWDFGDGDTSNLKNPWHTYTSSAYFHVCLTIYSDSACSNSNCATLAIGPKTGCQAGFAYNVISDETAQFISTSTTQDSVASYLWVFGDGDSSNLKSPVHTFPTYGTFSTCLYIVSAGGCSSGICEDTGITIGTCSAGFDYSYATGSTIDFTGVAHTADTLSSYSWSFGDGGTNNSSLTPSHSYSANGTYKVIFTMNATNGCSAADTGYVRVPRPICNASYTYSTSGDTVFFTNASTSNGTLTYNWSFFGLIDTSTSPNPVVVFPGTAHDSLACLTIQSDSGCTAEYCNQIIFGGNVVWPGDANDDLYVNNDDLIPIGLYYGETGPARDTTTNTWAPHPATNWDSSQTNGRDRKYVDCNGDGVINADDTLAVTLNYGLYHPDYAPRAISRSTEGAVALSIVTDSTSYHTGSIVHASVILGSSSAPASVMYGLAYTITVANSIVKPGTMSFVYDNSSFLGVKNSNVLVITHISNGVVGTAVTGIDHANRTGYGKIGDLYFTLANSTYSQQSISINSNDAVDAAGNQKAVQPVNDTVTVTTGVQNITSPVNGVGEVYPNPASNIANLEINLNTGADIILSVTNILGQQVYISTNHVPTGSTLLNIPTAALESGVYFVEIHVNDSATIVRKLIKE